jgi:hypothetical protein
VVICPPDYKLLQRGNPGLCGLDFPWHLVPGPGRVSKKFSNEKPGKYMKLEACTWGAARNLSYHRTWPGQQVTPASRRHPSGNSPGWRIERSEGPPGCREQARCPFGHGGHYFNPSAPKNHHQHHPTSFLVLCS